MYWPCPAERGVPMPRFRQRALVAAAMVAIASVASVGSGAGSVAAKAPPPSRLRGQLHRVHGHRQQRRPGRPQQEGHCPTSTTPSRRNAGLYAWGMATEPDGSILTGDYWNYRIVHYEDDQTATSAPTAASPYVFSQTTLGFGADTTQAPFGICVDNSGGPLEGYVYETEGSLYDVNQYSSERQLGDQLGDHRRREPGALPVPLRVHRGPQRLRLHLQPMGHAQQGPAGRGHPRSVALRGDRLRRLHHHGEP